MIKSVIRLALCYFLICGQTIAYAQSTAAILPQGKTQFFDNNGDPLTSGKVYFYIPSTTTPKTTWQDSSKSVANANPVVLDGGGRAIIYGDGTYRQIVKDRNNNTIYDAVTASAGSGGGTTGTGDGDLVGTIKPWAGLVAPNQYAFAYGQEVSRTTYSTLFTAITSQQSINCTSGSPILTGLSDTSQIPLSEGGIVEATCVPAGSKAIAKTSTSLTIDNNASITTTTTARIFLYGNGNGSTTFNLPDLRGLVVAGRNNMGGIASSRLTSTYFSGFDPNSTGSVGGSQSSTLVTGNLPPYTPVGTNAQVTGTISQITPAGTNSTSSVTGSSTISTFPTGAGGSTNTFFTPTSTGTSASVSITTATAAAQTFSGTPVTPTFTGSTPTFTGTAQGGTSTAYSIVQPTHTLNYIIKITPDSNSADASGVTSLGGMTGDIACGTGLLCTGNIISSTVTSLWAQTGNDIYNLNSGNVGIGTNSPGAELSLSKIANQTDLITYTTADQAYFQFYQAQNFPTASAFGRSLDIVSLGGSGGGNIRLMTAPALISAITALSINSSQNIGLQTTSQTSLLELNNNWCTSTYQPSCDTSSASAVIWGNTAPGTGGPQGLQTWARSKNNLVNGAAIAFQSFSFADNISGPRGAWPIYTEGHRISALDYAYGLAEAAIVNRDITVNPLTPFGLAASATVGSTGLQLDCGNGYASTVYNYFSCSNAISIVQNAGSGNTSPFATGIIFSSTALDKTIYDPPVAIGMASGTASHGISWFSSDTNRTWNIYSDATTGNNSLHLGNGQATFLTAILSLYAANSSDSFLFIGDGATGNRSSYLNFGASNGVNDSFQILRGSGVNGGTNITNKGSGTIAFATNASNKFYITSTGIEFPIFGAGILQTSAGGVVSSSSVALSSLATQATNTIVGNATSGTASPTALTIGSCSTASSALIWTTNTGFGCNTSITAAAVSVGGITGLGTGVATALAVNIGTAGSFVVNGGALGSPSSAGTIPAFTLGGTIAGGGNQLNNIIIGTTTPLAGTFTTLGSGAHTITSSSATALTVGLNGATNPAFTVDASTASQAAGFKITGAATGGTVALVATDSGSNTNLTFNAKGSGTIGIGSVSTGIVTITPNVTHSGTTTLSGALTYGGVTLSNSVTGTGSMALSSGPTFTGTLTMATPFTLGATSVTSTGTQLNYLNAATGTTGTTSTNVVFSTSPTLVTPTIGVATATSINKVAITAPATSATLTIADGTTLTETTSTSIGRGQYQGTGTNDAATAGNIGEVMTATLASGSAVSVSNNVVKSIIDGSNNGRITLTAGNWSVTCQVLYVPAGTTTVTFLNSWVSSTLDGGSSGADGGFVAFGTGQTFANTPIAVKTLPFSVSISGSTNYYCNSYQLFGTSTMTAYSYIYAVRIR